jgi:hypothetical protein
MLYLVAHVIVAVKNLLVRCGFMRYKSAMKNINISVTADEWARIQVAVRFLGRSVKGFARGGIMSGVEACEDDYIIYNGEVIGDRLKIEELGNDIEGNDETVGHE